MIVGECFRKKMEKEFDRRIVVSAYVDEIRKCCNYYVVAFPKVIHFPREEAGGFCAGAGGAGGAVTAVFVYDGAVGVCQQGGWRVLYSASAR